MTPVIRIKHTIELILKNTPQKFNSMKNECINNLRFRITDPEL